MARSPARKPSFNCLALLDWLCEAGEDRRLFVRTMNSRLYLFELGEPGPQGTRPVSRRIPDAQHERALLDRLGGKESFPTDILHRMGLVRHFHRLGHSNSLDPAQGRREYDALLASFARDPFHYNDSIFVPTEEGFRYWRETGRAELERQREARAEAREQVSRLVVIGATKWIQPTLPEHLKRLQGEGVPLPVPSYKLERRAYALARVVKETEARLTITDVEYLDDRNSFAYRTTPIQGREPNLYVDKDAVILDNATRRDARRLAEIDEEFASERGRIVEQTLEAIAPALRAMHDRLFQKASERDDLMREALEAIQARGASQADPENDEGAGFAP